MTSETAILIAQDNAELLAEIKALKQERDALIKQNAYLQKQEDFRQKRDFARTQNDGVSDLIMGKMMRMLPKGHFVGVAFDGMVEHKIDGKQVRCWHSWSSMATTLEEEHLERGGWGWAEDK